MSVGDDDVTIDLTDVDDGGSILLAGVSTLPAGWSHRVDHRYR